MKDPTAHFSPQAYARIGGVLYLIIIAAGLFAEAFVRSRLIVSADAAATATNILAHETLFRLGIAADLSTFLCAIAAYGCSESATPPRCDDPSRCPGSATGTSTTGPTGAGGTATTGVGASGAGGLGSGGGSSSSGTGGVGSGSGGAAGTGGGSSSGGAGGSTVGTDGGVFTLNGPAAALHIDNSIHQGGVWGQDFDFKMSDYPLSWAIAVSHASLVLRAQGIKYSPNAVLSVSLKESKLHCPTATDPNADGCFQIEGGSAYPTLQGLFPERFVGTHTDIVSGPHYETAALTLVYYNIYATASFRRYTKDPVAFFGFGFERLV